ncbi:unnamed protein product [Enterobius vermicularis]|uniref:Methyltransferase n=1 Tax=Enterobius vermicularis TaxID=51028 RepID=A0A0N4UWP8_ENTVE|nr:unnamed protein product [Enterobius vermicularis]
MSKQFGYHNNIKDLFFNAIYKKIDYQEEPVYIKLIGRVIRNRGRVVMCTISPILQGEMIWLSGNYATMLLYLLKLYPGVLIIYLEQKLCTTKPDHRKTLLWKTF